MQYNIKNDMTVVQALVFDAYPPFTVSKGVTVEITLAAQRQQG